MRPAIGGDRLEDSISTAMENCSDNAVLVERQREDSSRAANGELR